MGPEFGVSNGRGRFFTAREVRRFIHGGIPAWMKRRTLPMTGQSVALLGTLASCNLQTLTYLTLSSLSRWLPGLDSNQNWMSQSHLCCHYTTGQWIRGSE